MQRYQDFREACNLKASSKHVWKLLHNQNHNPLSSVIIHKLCQANDHHVAVANVCFHLGDRPGHGGIRRPSCREAVPNQYQTMRPWGAETTQKEVASSKLSFQTPFTGRTVLPLSCLQATSPKPAAGLCRAGGHLHCDGTQLLGPSWLHSGLGCLPRLGRAQLLQKTFPISLGCLPRSEEPRPASLLARQLSHMGLLRGAKIIASEGSFALFFARGLRLREGGPQQRQAMYTGISRNGVVVWIWASPSGGRECYRWLPCNFAIIALPETTGEGGRR